MTQIPAINHIPALDGIRAVAVSLVVIFHVLPLSLTGGFLGVDIFFVLSGYLITLLLLQEFKICGGIHFRYFYLRRALRLIPAFFLLVCTYLICSYVFTTSWDEFSPHAESGVISFFYLANWARAFDWYPATNYLSHTWSLAIEEQFYLFWPVCLVFLARLFRRIEWGVILGAVCLLVATWGWRYYLLDAGASYSRVYNGLDTRMDALMFGALAAAFYCAKKPSDRYLRYISPVITLIALALVVGMVMTSHWDARVLYVWQLPVIHIACAIAIFNLSHARGLVAVLLSQKPLVYIGRISYGVYLWHFPVLVVLAAFDWTGVSLLGATFICTLIIASASYYALELPALKLKRKFRPEQKEPV